MAKYQIICIECQKSFYVSASRLKAAKFCSRLCQSKYWRANPTRHPAYKRVKMTCETCGEEFSKSPSRIKKARHHFCGTKCRGKFRSTQLGAANPAYKRFDVPCAYCATVLQKIPSYIKAYKNIFCDVECRRKWMSENMRMHNHPGWSSVEIVCEYCKNPFFREPNQLKNKEHNFCSYACHGEWTSESGARSGENNPRWNGGHNAICYGPNWKERRSEARKRDGYTCQECSLPEYKHFQELDVHHIVPFRTFEQSQCKEANRLSNLITLCRRCHRKVEPY